MELLKQIAQDIRSYGGEPFIVGGWVRDYVLGIPSKDIDVEVYGMTLHDLGQVLKKYGIPKDCGKSFQVFKLGKYDFSLPRKEYKTGRLHTDFDVTIDPHMSVKDVFLEHPTPITIFKPIEATKQ